jgi:hypothetical protein
MFFVPGRSAFNSKVVRLALGITFGFGVAQMVNWQLSFLLPILMSMLLSGPGIELKMGIGFIAMILVGTMLGMLLTLTVVQVPLVCLLVISLLMFHIFYAANKGLSPLLVVMLLMGVTAIPLVGLQSGSLAWMIVEGLAVGGTIAVVFAVFFFWLIPEETVTASASPAAVAPGQIASPFRSALVSMLVMLPLVIVFYTFSLTGGILVFVFAAILAQTPDLTVGVRSSVGLLIANALGGVFAIVVYGLLVAMPEFVFMLLLMFIVTLMFAQKIFSASPYAALYSTAYTAVLLLVGNSMGDTSASAGENFLIRILQIMAAAAYVVSAFYILSRLFGHRKTSDELKSGHSEPAIQAENTV